MYTLLLHTRSTHAHWRRERDVENFVGNSSEEDNIHRRVDDGKGTCQAKKRVACHRRVDTRQAIIRGGKSMKSSREAGFES